MHVSKHWLINIQTHIRKVDVNYTHWYLYFSPWFTLDHISGFMVRPRLQCQRRSLPHNLPLSYFTIAPILPCQTPDLFRSALGLVGLGNIMLWKAEAVTLIRNYCLKCLIRTLPEIHLVYCQDATQQKTQRPDTFLEWKTTNQRRR